MAKILERTAAWLPLGFGEARRNLVAGLISTVFVLWLLQGIAERKGYSYSAEFDRLKMVFSDYEIAIIIPLIFLLVIGRFVDFFGSLFPFVYYVIFDDPHQRPSKFVIFRTLIYRHIRRRRKIGLTNRWRYSGRILRKINKRLDWIRHRDALQEFQSKLSIDAKDTFEEIPNVIKDGLVHPLWWNFEISVNFIISEVSEYHASWIIQNENKRKFIYMIISSIFASAIIYTTIALSISFPELICNMAYGIEVDRPKSNLKSHEVASFLALALLAPLVFFASYKKHVEALCVLYAEVLSIHRHRQQIGSQAIKQDIAQSDEQSHIEDWSSPEHDKAA